MKHLTVYVRITCFDFSLRSNAGGFVIQDVSICFVGVHMAARSLITLYRQLNPDMLHKKHRVRHFWRYKVSGVYSQSVKNEAQFNAAEYLKVM